MSGSIPVDDATVVRSLVSRWVDETPGLKLVAAVKNGREALEWLDHARPDVVVLDDFVQRILIGQVDQR